MVASTGPLATIDGKFRQAWKGATVAIDSCAGVWLVGVHHQFLSFCSSFSSFSTLIDRFSDIYSLPKPLSLKIAPFCLLTVFITLRFNGLTVYTSGLYVLVNHSAVCWYWVVHVSAIWIHICHIKCWRVNGVRNPLKPWWGSPTFLRRYPMRWNKAVYTMLICLLVRVVWVRPPSHEF